MNRLSVCVATAVLLIAAISGCTAEKGEPGTHSEKTEAARAFVIGLLPEQNVFVQKKRYGMLAEYLSVVTGMRVKTKLLDSYDAVYRAMASREVDAAFFGSLSYIVMNSRVDLEPVARPVFRGGVSTYRGVIFTRRDRPVTKDTETWKDRTIALVNRSTTAGYIYPRWYLLKKGIGNFDGYFRKVIFTGSHDAAVLAVFRGDADIGCAKDTIIRKVLDENPSLRREIVYLVVSDPVPSNTLSVRSDMDGQMKESLREALIGINGTPGGVKALSALGAERFIPTAEPEYEPVMKMLADLKITPEEIAGEETK